MGTLSAFLKEEAERLAGQKDTRQRSVREWRDGVTKLFDRIEGQVRAADTEGVLTVERGDIPRVERRLGGYTAPYLTIRLDTQAVHFVPLARFAAHTIRLEDKGRIANAGCVVVTDGDQPSEGPARFTLYRTPPYRPGEGYRAFDTGGDTDEQVHWFVRRPGADLGTADVLLDQGVLDGILVGALR